MMTTRKSPRRNKYDYSSAGGYQNRRFWLKLLNFRFVTICTKDREYYFGEIMDGKMILSEIGTRCEQEINDTNLRRNYAEIDEYIIMPNHVHFIVFISEIHTVGTCGNTSLLGYKSSELETLPCVLTGKQNPNQTLGSIIRNIKSRVTKYANERDIAFGRQGRYHDRIIRNQQEYDKIKYYIQTNLQNWENDTFNK